MPNMPDDDNRKLTALLTDVERYLMQEKDLFGNDVFLEPKKSAAPDRIDYPEEPWVKLDTLGKLDKAICMCVKCPLGHTRTRFVFGVGNPNADVMFIGEAPGADEDAQGEPFVGRAGQLLNKIIEAVGMKREEVYICNILKCRPPNNREPQTSEMETCTPYLYRQIELIKPKFIICLGRVSAQWLLKTNDSLGALREKVHDFLGAKLLVTYHPAALLRNPNWKRPTWEDMKKFKAMYEETKKGG
jgi:uracil-DNA glycosylase family 4